MMVRHDWASYNSETWKKVTGEWTYKNFTQWISQLWKNEIISLFFVLIHV
jgi:hypothetical protein